MATTLDTICSHLDQLGLRYRRGDDEIGLSYRTERYRALDDEPRLIVVCRVVDNGHYLKVFAPRAFETGERHRDAVLESCLRFQWQYRLVRIELDPSDGELRPAVHLPLMDAELGVHQLGMTLHLFVSLCNTLYDVIQAAQQDGTVMPEDYGDSVTAHRDRARELAERLAALPPEEIEFILAALAATPDGDAPDGESPDASGEAA